MGFPIVGDNLYGNTLLDKYFFYKNKFIRLFLHSYYVSFFHPNLKKNIYLYAKLDYNFLFILNNLN